MNRENLEIQEAISKVKNKLSSATDTNIYVV
jgi:hypothetical protein